MKTLSHFLLLLLLLPASALAQDYKRTWNWYFGKNAGLNFSTNPPTVLTNGILDAWEGCATISDTNGNLQFYTDGRTVYNRNHQIMQNGTGLNGGKSSTQAALIIPIPANDSLFYIFTTDEVAKPNGLQYSIVNINLNGGLGQVIQKNTLLHTPTCERLAATYHENGKDIWIMSHDFGNNIYRAYLITKRGLIPCPIISYAGSSTGNHITHAQGHLKFSKDGKKVFNVIYDWYVEILSFNPTSGMVSEENKIILNGIKLPYAIELSPNMRFVYVTDRGQNIYQFDLSLKNSDSINAKRYTVSTMIPEFAFHSMQIATNGKIYIANYDSMFLSSINYPDSVEAKCDFQYGSLSLAGKKSQAGLANYISSYFYNPLLNINYSVNCNNLEADFTAQTSNITNNWQWRIKKLDNGSASFLNIKNFTYNFSDTGLYEVRLIANNDTVIKNIFIDAPILPQTDTLGCGVDSVVLRIPSSYRCLQWSDTSAQSHSRIIKTNGTYYIQGYNSHGCLITDSISINFNASPVQPVITKINDSLQSTPSYTTYQWFLNDTTIVGANSQRIKPLKAGMYKVLITDSNGCSNVSNAFSSNVGVQEFLNRPISIYPNPARSEIIFESVEEFDINITTITGQSILLEKYKSGRNILNVSSFSKGVYFIQINTNSKTYNQKIIIQ